MKGVFIIGILSDWIQVTKNKDIDHNLEIAPLQIITNTKLGVSDNMYLHVNNIGAIKIEFSHSRFWVQNCGPYHDFPSSLPETGDKKWEISKTKETLTVLCNNVEVLNLIYSNVSESCSNSWSKNSSSLRFNDWASDYYRNPFGQGKKCSFSYSCFFVAHHYHYFKIFLP